MKFIKSHRARTASIGSRPAPARIVRAAMCERLEQRRLLTNIGGVITAVTTYPADNYVLTSNLDIRNTVTFQTGSTITSSGGYSIVVNDTGSTGNLVISNGAVSVGVTVNASGSSSITGTQLNAGLAANSPVGLTLANDTFASGTFKFDIAANSGSTFISNAFTSSATVESSIGFVPQLGNSFGNTYASGLSSVAVLCGESLTGSATWPVITNAASVSLSYELIYDGYGSLYVASGGSLTIASGVTVSTDSNNCTLNVQSGGSLTSSGDTFSSNLDFSSGSSGSVSGDTLKGVSTFDVGQSSLGLTSNTFASTSSVRASVGFVPQLGNAYGNAYASGVSSVAVLCGESLTGSVTWPVITNAASASLSYELIDDGYGSSLYVASGGSLTIAPGVTVTTDTNNCTLNAQSGSLLDASGDAFSSNVEFSSGSSGLLSGDTFRALGTFDVGRSSLGFTSNSFASTSSVRSSIGFVPQLGNSYGNTYAPGISSVSVLSGESLTGSVNWPLVTNSASATLSYELIDDGYGSSLYVASAGSLTIASGVTVSTDSNNCTLNVQSGGSLTSSGDTFSSNLQFSSGSSGSVSGDTLKGVSTFDVGQSSLALTSNTFASTSSVRASVGFVPQLGNSFGNAYASGVSSVAVLCGESLTGSVTWPVITNAASASLSYELIDDGYGASLYVASGGSLTIAPGVTVSTDSNNCTLNVQSGGSLTSSGDTFSSNLQFSSGSSGSVSGDTFRALATFDVGQSSLGLTSNTFASTSSVRASVGFVPQLGNAYGNAYASGVSSVAVLCGESLTGSVTWPVITNAASASLSYELIDDGYGASLYVASGGSLTIAPGVTVSTDSNNCTLNAQSGGSLFARQVTFGASVQLSNGSTGFIDYSQFNSPSLLTMSSGSTASVHKNAISRASAMYESGTVNLTGNYWTDTSASLILQNHITDKNTNSNYSTIDYSGFITAGSPALQGPVGEVFFGQNIVPNSFLPPYSAVATSSIYGTDFGATVTQYDTAVSHTFTLYNAGPGALSVYNIAISAGSPFSLSSYPTSLASGTSGTFTITLSTSAAYSGTATVTLETSDPDVGSYAFAIGATVSPIHLAFTNQTPSGIQAGNTFVPVIQVQNANGQVVSPAGIGSAVLSLLSGPAGASLNGAQALTVAFSGGVAVFPALTLTNAGTYSLQASSSLATAAAKSVTVTPGAAVSLALTGSLAATYQAGQSLPTLTATETDAYGNPVGGTGATVSISASPVTTLVGSTSGTLSSSGTVTFSGLAIDLVGTYSLTATSGSLAAASTPTFTVTAGAPSRIVLASGPSSSVVAGNAIGTIVADVEDAHGNIVTSDSTTLVTLAASSGPGAVFGGAIEVVNSGVATFSTAYLEKAGNYEIVASASGLAASAQSAVAVLPGAASTLAFAVQPSALTPNVSMSPAPTVDVLDAYGNVVTSDASTVSLALAANASGTVATGTLSVGAVAGVATFSDVQIGVAGAYQLIATDGALSSATSASFNVTAAVPTTATINSGPSNTAAGSTIRPVSLTIYNQSGSVDTTDTTPITVEMRGTGGTVALSGTLSQPISNGTVTFPDLSSTVAGSGYQLEFFAGTRLLATSAKFAITAGAGIKLSFVPGANPQNGSAGTPLAAISLEVTDAYGNIATLSVPTVTPSAICASGTATFVGTPKSSIANGVITFTGIVFQDANHYQIAFSAPGLSSAVQTITIGAATTASISVGAPAAGTVTAGQSSNTLTATLDDGFGNVATGSTAPVTLTLGGQVVTVVPVDGVAVFVLPVLTLVGSYTPVVTQGSVSSSGSEAIVVTFAPAAKLVIVSPPGGTPGNAVTVIVDVQDVYGNLVTGNSGTPVTLSGGGPGSAPVVVVTEGGVATFTNVVIAATGSYSFSASAPSLASPSPVTVVIVLPVLTDVSAPVLTVIIAGTKSTKLIVRILDQFGNPFKSSVARKVTLVVRDVATGKFKTYSSTVPKNSSSAAFPAVSFTLAGGYTFSTTGVGLGGGSSSFTVAPGPVASMVFSSPKVIVGSGTLFSEVVTLKDKYGNIETADTSTVSLFAKFKGTNTLLQSGQVSGGLASFLGLSRSVPGTYSLIASDPEVKKTFSATAVVR